MLTRINDRAAQSLLYECIEEEDTMRSILVHAMNDAGFDARLQVGLDLCRRFNAHLTVLQTITYDLVVPRG